MEFEVKNTIEDVVKLIQASFSNLNLDTDSELYLFLQSWTLHSRVLLTGDFTVESGESSAFRDFSIPPFQPMSYVKPESVRICDDRAVCQFTLERKKRLVFRAPKEASRNKNIYLMLSSLDDPSASFYYQMVLNQGDECPVAITGILPKGHYLVCFLANNES